ncbi:unnamed protein product [Rhizoctonia solani]|uniref:Uncharacterized protein n=1 Tax=Rhizoctonia solani TaxID=456999 RepID=A0A8H3AX29_9AGAM|nr:unnamed protein product [Rhizoctonia solani]
MTTQIGDKLRGEKERRLRLGIKGPWPDYRQPSFPTTTAGFTYHFILLGFACEDAGPIYRRKDLDDPNAGPWDSQQYYPPSFAGFPTLNLHVHPYAAILNVFPKLEKHLKTRELPPPADSSYEEIKFIYDTLTNPFEDSKPNTLPGSNATIMNGARGGLDMASHDSLSGLPPHPDVLLKGVAEWIACVEHARGQNLNALVGLEDDSSFETAQYTTEPTRAPPALDWHEWKSKFAPWWYKCAKYHAYTGYTEHRAP